MDHSAYVMPVAVGIQLAHATVQQIADDEGIDVLHIKGPAVDPRLTPGSGDGGSSEGSEVSPSTRHSTDADVWVRPSQASEFLRVLARHDWVLELSFQDDSVFEHAATLVHPILAPIDVHRRFPGIGAEPERAFEVLWADRQIREIAHFPCWVPGLTAQRLVLLINAARGKLAGNEDVASSWVRATAAERAEVDALASRLGAQVALAAGTGRLNDYRGWREYALWDLLSSGSDSLAALWWARIRAQPTLSRAVRMAFKQVFPSPMRIKAIEHGDLSRLELARAYLKRVKLGVSELRRLPDHGPRAKGG